MNDPTGLVGIQGCSANDRRIKIQIIIFKFIPEPLEVIQEHKLA